jgi:hypothetical protein
MEAGRTSLRQPETVARPYDRPDSHTRPYGGKRRKGWSGVGATATGGLWCGVWMLMAMTMTISDMMAHAAELELHLPTLVSHSGESRPTHPRRGPHGTARVLVEGVRHYDGVLMRQEVRRLHPHPRSQSSMACFTPWQKGFLPSAISRGDHLRRCGPVRLVRVIPGKSTAPIWI